MMIRETDWRLIIACVVMSSCTMGAALVVFPLWVVPWSTEFRVGHGNVLAALSLANLSMGSLAPVVGWLLDRHPPRYIAIAGGILLAAGLFGAAQATSMMEITLIYLFAVGGGLAFCGIVPAQMIAVRSCPEKAGIINGLIVLGLALGGGLLPLFLIRIVSEIGWRGALLIEAAFVLLIVVFLATIFLPKTVHAASTVSPVSSTQQSSDIMMLLRRGEIWLIVLALLPVQIIAGGVQASTVGITTGAGASEAMGGVLLTGVLVAAGAGSLIIGWVVDRVPVRSVYFLVACSLASGMVVLALASSVPLLWIGFCLFGFGGGGGMALQAVFVVRHFGSSDFPKALGLVAAFMLPSVFGPMAAGGIRDFTGSYDAALLLFAFLMLPGAVATWILHKRSPDLQKVAFVSAVERH